MRNLAALKLDSKDRCFALIHTEPMHIGQRIKSLMQSKGVTTELMAFQCGVTPGAVSNWFSSGQITRDNLVAVADVLGESVRYLITGDPRDRAVGMIEAAFVKREVSLGTLEAVLTLIRSSPLRQDDPPPPDLGSEEDAAHFARALEQSRPRPKTAKRQQRKQ